MNGILCLMTGTLYPTVRQAAEGVGVSLPTALKSINQGHAIMHRKLKIYTWLVAPASPPPLPPSDSRQKRVRCVTTNTIYETMSEAAKAHGVELSQMSRAIRTKTKMHGKLFEKVIS